MHHALTHQCITVDGLQLPAGHEPRACADCAACIVLPECSVRGARGRPAPVASVPPASFAFLGGLFVHPAGR